MSFHINIEIKARTNRLEEIRTFLKKNATELKGTDHQIDTYFETNNGRLKLREGNIENTLIFYDRPNTQGPKQSDVNLVYLEPNSGLRETLRKSNNIKVVVDKKREIYFIDNIKFHIDDVKALGSFVEIEAIDTTGNFTVQTLREQCQKYINAFKIEEEDFIDISYSDMILEQGRKFRVELEKQFQIFMSNLFSALKDKNIDLSHNYLDHICYRVETAEEYCLYQNNLNLFSDLLIESSIGGRSISTFKLHKPLRFEQRIVDIIELPSPKESHPYKRGFEHAEFVIDEDFKNFSNKFNFEFDWKGTKKKHNPELRLNLNENLSIKLHHKSLEEVIHSEKNSSLQ